MVERIKKFLRHPMWSIVAFVFPRTVQAIEEEALTGALHPDFGWFWREDEEGGKLCAELSALREKAVKHA